MAELARLAAASAAADSAQQKAAGIIRGDKGRFLFASEIGGGRFRARRGPPSRAGRRRVRAQACALPRRGGCAVWPPMTAHSRSHPALRRGRWVGCLLSSSWRGTVGKLKWARDGRKGLKKAETPLSPRHHKPLSADIQRNLRPPASPPRSHAVPTMVSGLGYTVRSIAFRILTMVVHFGLVQQQFSMADVKAASEALEKGDSITVDMCTQSLDAGENTVTQRELTNVADAIGSSADAAVCCGDAVNEGTRKESTIICSVRTSNACICLKRQTDASQLSVRQRAGAAGAVVSLQAAPAASRTVPSEALLGFSPGAAR